MSHPHQWLQRQLPNWVDAGLISSDQARELAARHPPPQASDRARTVFTVLGALLLGLGAILLIAYNWADMHRYVKLALVLGMLLAAHGAALASHGRAAVEGLHALGTMLFGAGIWLVAQIYHIDGHYPDAFLLWGLGALALAWALPSLVQALLAAGLIITWQATELADFQATSHGAPWLLLMGLLPLVGRLRSAVLGSLAAGTLLASLTLNAARSDLESFIAAIPFIAAGFSALGLLLSELRPGDSGRAYQGIAVPGFLMLVIMLFVLSFPEAAEEAGELALDGPWRSPWFSGGVLFAFGLWGALWWQQYRAAARLPAIASAVLAGLFVLLIVLLVPLRNQEVPLAILFNLGFLGLAVAFILAGARRHESRLLRIGILLILMLAGARYLDLFDSLLARALAFCVAGALLFAGGLAFRRWQREEET